MYCPRCKAEISQDDVVCPKCNLRLQIICPRCGTKARLGSSSCKKCGFVFVKFCPKCNSANYVSATQCRKCFYNFPKEHQEDDSTGLISVRKMQSNPNSANFSEKANKPTVKNYRLMVFINFLTLENLFGKFTDEEFRQKVLLNIKTSVKMTFNTNCEFISKNTVNFLVNYNKKIGIMQKIDNFKNEFQKFNRILADTLGVDISYKFVIIEAGEYTKGKMPEQLNYGASADIITSEVAYGILNDEISLIKVAPTSYKMIFLEQKPEFAMNELTEPDTAFDLIANTIEDETSEIKAISLNAPRGFGKTHLLDLLKERFDETQTILLTGHCTPLTQVTPLGLIQDIFLTLFKLTFAPSKYEKRVNDIRELLKRSFPVLTDIDLEAIDTLVNIVYPVKEDIFENILENKHKTFRHLKLLFEVLRSDNKLVFVIDDFDMIDEASFEFLKYLIQSNFFNKTTKLLLVYKNQHAIGMYITSDKLPKDACLNINLAPKSYQDIKKYVESRFLNRDTIPDVILNEIINYSGGNFAYIEQVFDYLLETKKITKQGDKYIFGQDFSLGMIPKNLDDVLNLRYDILKNNHPREYKFLNLASLLGGRFNKFILARTLNLDDKEFIEIANSLIDKNYIKKTGESSYLFKNNLLWSHIYSVSKEDELLRELQGRFLSELCEKTVASPAIKALIAQTTGNKKLAFELWTKNLKYASYIGDVALYILSQKQSLALIENSNLSDPAYVKNNICERVGKLTYSKNPKEAIGFLSNAVACAQKNNDQNKIVELSGYLIQSCKAVQNYPAIVETVDAVLDIYAKPKMELQRALIKTRKLLALLYMGNWEEIVNLVNNEINPVLEDYLKRPRPLNYTNREDIYKTYLEANIFLVEAYAQQGSSSVFELIEELEKDIFKEKNKKLDLLQIKLNLALATAMAYTTKGLVKLSDEILQSVVKDFAYAIDDSKIVAKWNTIDIFNKVLRGDCEEIKDNLFDAVSFANNAGDEYNKNLLKILLAEILLEENKPLKAFEITSDEMTYFSKEKIALGALLSWYVSAKASLATGDIERAIEICEKSIKICKNTKINAITFNILFNYVMAKAYLINKDLDNAKMYIELALQEATANEAVYFQMKIYCVRAMCMRETLKTTPPDKRQELFLNIIKVYEKAMGIANKLGMPKQLYLVQKELSSFKAFCKLNNIGNIKVKKEE